MKVWRRDAPSSAPKPLPVRWLFNISRVRKALQHDVPGAPVGIGTVRDVASAPSAIARDCKELNRRST